MNLQEWLSGQRPGQSYTVLNGSDGFRAACLEHNWLCTTLRSTFAVAAVDYLKHIRESHS